MMNTYIIVSLQLEGIHYWKQCDLSEVNYLTHPHRHVFQIKMKKRVEHDNREIEFIKLKHEVSIALEAEFFDKDYMCLNFGNASCEQLAKMLINNYDLSSCEVLEDGENGALVESEELL